MAVRISSEPAPLANQVSAEDAREAATDFLLDNLGNLLIAGEPHVMVSAVRAMWIVPVQLAYIHTGVLGNVGVVAVDQETGQVIAWTPIPEIKAASRRLRAQHEPELAKQFQATISLHPSMAGRA